jgi:hypothetical protein
MLRVCIRVGGFSELWMKIVRGTDLQRKLLLVLVYWGTLVESGLA